MTSNAASIGTPLVSIAIPTYNRAPRLRETLNRLGTHAEIFEDWVEIVVSDNASTDDTAEVVSTFSERTGKTIRYARNETNVGIDGNIHAVSRLGSGRYLLLMSDDDLLLPGALSKLRSLVETTPDLLFCFVNGGSFSGSYDPQAKLPSIVPMEKTLVTNDPNEVLAALGVWSTFISSFFVERKAWISVPEPESFIGSDIYLTHILFRLLAKEPGRTCVVTSEHWLAARAEFTGSFRVLHAFAYSFLKLVVKDAPAMGLSRTAMRRIKLHVLRRALPPMVHRVRRRDDQSRALNAAELRALLCFTWWEPTAWAFLFPVALMPSSIIDGLIRMRKSLRERRSTAS